MRAKIDTTQTGKTKVRGFSVRRPATAGSLGFTVIEVMLFLAISAGLIVALLATVGTTISRQRFTDSVASLQAFMQQQINLATTVTNDRGQDTCGASADGATSTGVGAVTSGRGASNCVILGRAVDLGGGSPGSETTITIHNVVGTEPAAEAAATKTGAALLKLYRPGIDTQTASTYDIPWGASVASVLPTNVSRLLFLRSPDSGEVLTFGAQGGDSLDDALSTGDRTYNVCIRSADFVGAIGVVRVLPVSGSEAVQTKTYLNGADKASLCAL